MRRVRRRRHGAIHQIRQPGTRQRCRLRFVGQSENRAEVPRAAPDVTDLALAPNPGTPEVSDWEEGAAPLGGVRPRLLLGNAI